MHYNEWNSSDVEHRLKQHALQILNISLTIDTIHVWNCVGLLAGFWIKRKFQDTSLHHTSITPSSRHWSHYLILKEKITNSLRYVGGAKVKNSFTCTNEGVFILKGEIDPCGCSTTPMTIWLPWLFVQQVEMWVTRLMTWLEMT